MKNNYASEFMAIVFLIVLACIFCYIFCTKDRVIVVTITDSTATFKSNYNAEGDRYFILKGKDTLSKGIFYDNKWR